MGRQRHGRMPKAAHPNDGPPAGRSIQQQDDEPRSSPNLYRPSQRGDHRPGPGHEPAHRIRRCYRVRPSLPQQRQLRRTVRLLLRLAQAHRRIHPQGQHAGSAPHRQGKRGHRQPGPLPGAGQGIRKVRRYPGHPGLRDQDGRDIQGMPPGHQARRNHDCHVHPQVHRRLGRTDCRAYQLGIRHYPDLAG